MKFSDHSNKLLIAFDTSCDETSVAVLKGRRVLANIVSSQIELHKKWGGVVPDVARRAHEENITGSYKEALKRAKVSIEDIDVVAATIGPGLAIDLEIGLQFAQQLAVEYKKPFVPVNHMEGHLLSSLLLNSKGSGSYQGELEELFPALAILTSGKHTEIIYSPKLGEYIKLGKTLDDAAGEAFDKVGRMLGFGYPGGPIVSEFAKKSNGGYKEFGLPVPMKQSGDLNFSYSGLKTACLYKLKELRQDNEKKNVKDSEFVYDFCNEFVNVVVQSIVIKVKAAIKQYPDAKTVFGGGGVFNNEKLVRVLGSTVKSYGLNYYVPEIKYRSDNASMIGIAGLRGYFSGEAIIDKDELLEIDREPRLQLGEM